MPTTQTNPSWTNRPDTDDRITMPGGARESSPSWTASRESSPSWTPTLLPPAPQIRKPTPTERNRAAAPTEKNHASSISSRHTSEIVESLQTFVERFETMKDGGKDGESLFATVRKFARHMQHKVARLGGVAPRAEQPIATDDRGSRPSTSDRASRPSTSDRASRPSTSDRASRPSTSTSLDGYRPDVDVVAPISVRSVAMELLWVCGDCGEHYPRARQCPESCKSCGAPKQHFYAPIED